MIKKFIKALKTYLNIGSVTFGTVYLGNTLTGLTLENPPINPYIHKSTFISKNLLKSLYFGIVWPSIPFSLLQNNGFNKLFILNNNLKRI
jgi:hypothetical protein